MGKKIIILLVISGFVSFNNSHAFLHEEYHGGSDSAIGEDKNTTGDVSTPDNRIADKGVLEKQLANEKDALGAIDKEKRMKAEQKLFDISKNFKERLKMIEARKNRVMDIRQGVMQRRMQGGNCKK